MNEKALRVLEYNKIVYGLSNHTVSPITREFALKIKPLNDIYKIRECLAQTSEAVKMITAKGNPPMGAFYDITGFLGRAKKGASLTMGQLLRVAYNVNCAGAMIKYLKDDMDTPALDAMREVLAYPGALSAEIERCIISEDEMADNASSELRSIRRSIIRQNEAIKAKMNHIIGSSDGRTMLQDAIVTMRDGRYVVPVKQEHRARFPGIIHDQSSTGATLFIEPQVIVNMNNELRELELAERKEIERILSDLSGRTAEHFYELKNNQKLLRELDYIFAKGKYSLSYQGEEPEMAEDGELILKEARHPMLDRKKAIPINVALGGEYNTLIITGPNTGGKTVTLKTAGLLSMMAMSGLHIPASCESRVPVFKDIFADIGDEQSIEQSLSTFSSHMNNIVSIVRDSKKGCMVLLDELGAGTDPTEGAALAISIIEKLQSKGAIVFATTHYTELKKYAISTAGVENASMEFDVETLSPTYRLTIGIPGKSNAFEISKKLGLEAGIIDKARALLEHGDIEFEEVVSAMEEDRKAIARQRDMAIQLKVQMEKQKKELDAREKEIKMKKDDILKKAREEARDIVREAKDITKEVQKELKELNKLDSAAERNKLFNENRKKVRELSDKHQERIVKQVNNKPVTAEELKIGDRVKVLTLDQNGEIISLPDDKGVLSVQVGILKAQVNLEDICLIEEPKPKKVKKDSSYGSLYRSKAMQLSTSINVRGSNLDDAIMDVDKYLDDAFMAGLKQVTVIHGRGEGILKNGLQQMMRHHKHVKSFHKGSYDEGGDGVTVVELKQEG